MRTGTSLALAFLLATGACSIGQSYGPPETLEAGSYEKVDRTVENDLMRRAAAVLRGLGLQEPFGAAYEFLLYKPQFFLGVGRGTADPEAVMYSVLPLFGGENGPGEEPRELARGDGRFLCAPYTHTGVPGSSGGSGLVSIAAVCTWSEDEIAGFGIGVAGLGVEDVLRMTAEARSMVDG
jgi:hypothetical protein